MSSNFGHTASPYCGSSINWDLIPTHMQSGVAAYIESGQHPGDFLEAFLTNDLRGAFDRADGINRERMGDYVTFFFNYAPSPCWGSAEKFNSWCARGGLRRFSRDTESAGA